jgi:hypothetical protein
MGLHILQFKANNNSQITTGQFLNIIVVVVVVVVVAAAAVVVIKCLIN